MADELDRARHAIAQWHLGQTSERYESSNLGAGTISTGANDHGGVSYGAYQLSSREGTVHEYLRQSKYSRDFDDLTPATPAFDVRWREVAAREPAAFKQDQHDFIGRTHYEREVARLQAVGIDLSDRGRAVQDMLWSTSVQMRGLTRGIVRGALRADFGPDFELSRISDQQLIASVQDYKAERTTTLFRSSPRLWNSLERRAHAEKADLLELAGHEEVVQASRVQPPLPAGDRDCIVIPGSRVSSPDPAVPGAATQSLQSSVERAVAQLDRSLGRMTDDASHRMSASLTKLALDCGITHVDHVVLSERTDTVRERENVFIVQGRLDDAAHRNAYMRTRDAVDAAPGLTQAAVARLESEGTVGLHAAEPAMEHERHMAREQSRAPVRV